MSLDLIVTNVALFMLVLARWASFVMLAPMLGGRTVPAYVKIALSFSISVVVFPLVIKGQLAPDNPVIYSMALIRETLIGLSIGFVSQQILFILQGAGQIIDTQMGFSIGSLIDPINSTPAPLTGNFKVLLATLLLLATNAHHLLIMALARSYDTIPVLGSGPSMHLVEFGINFLSGTFSAAVQVALPIAGVLVLAELGLGIASRTLPQMNIFLVGFPVKIGLGLILLLWMVPMMGSQVEVLFQNSLTHMYTLMQGWK